MSKNLNWRQFGPLYHGTDTPDLEEINAEGAPRYPVTSRWGVNYATTSLEDAKKYAESSASGHPHRSTGERYPVVYEVEPAKETYKNEYTGKRNRFGWAPDPHGGTTGWYDGYNTKSEAFHAFDAGAPVALMFEAPLRVKRTVWAENKAKDITPKNESFS